MTPPQQATRWLTAQEQRAWRSFLRAHALLLARLHRQLHDDSGLSLSDYEVLVHLTEAPEERLRIRELSSRLNWEKSRVSHQVTRMEHRGLVERQECESDARGQFVAVTGAGRAAIRSAAPRHVEEVRRWFVDALDPDELRRLADAAEAIVANCEGGDQGR